MFFCYHTIVNSLYPVPMTASLEEVAGLADVLDNRIYFEADLTTKPIDEDTEWWVKRAGQWHWFLTEKGARDNLRLNGTGQLYFKEVRKAEVFLTEIKEK